MIAATSVRELSDDAREVLVHRYIDGLYAIGAGKLLAAVTDLDEMCATMYDASSALQTVPPTETGASSSMRAPNLD